MNALLSAQDFRARLAATARRVVNKSGANSFNAYFWTYLQRQEWNANSFQNNVIGATRWPQQVAGNSLFIRSDSTVTTISGTVVDGVRGIWAIDGKLTYPETPN